MKLLKKTDQFKEQATRLELEYDKLFTEQGQSKDPELDGSAALVHVNDTEVPKLNLSVVHI